MVDNEEHLFLTENFIVTHNTRYAIGDACKFAFPYMYDNELCEWVVNGYNEQVLFVCTEQQIVEVQDMVIAYLSGVNQDKFRYGNFSRNELKRLNTAVQIVEDFPNLHILCIPNPSVKLVKTLIREQAIYLILNIVFLIISLHLVIYIENLVVII